jgi:hypothetical protein
MNNNLSADIHTLELKMIVITRRHTACDECGIQFYSRGEKGKTGSVSLAHATPVVTAHTLQRAKGKEKAGRVSCLYLPHGWDFPA